MKPRQGFPGMQVCPTRVVLFVTVAAVSLVLIVAERI